MSLRDSHPCIVVLDDERQVRSSLAGALRAANPHWEVMEASRSHDALQAVIRDRVAVLICDQELADRSGVDVLAEARALSPDTVGILLLDRIDGASCLDSVNVAGAFRCLHKPFQAYHFVTDVAESIGEHRRRSAVQRLIEQMQGARA